MNNKTGPLSAVAVDPLVIRHSKTKCSYKCRYFQDGAVVSYCNKYHKALKYNGAIPPLLTDECKAAAQQALGRTDHAPPPQDQP